MIDSAATGGAEHVIWSLLEGLPRSRVEPYLVCPASGPMLERYRQAAASVAALEGRSCLSPRSILQIASLIRRWKIDVVHTCLYTSDVGGILAARIAGAPRVVSHIVGRNFYVTEERGLLRMRRRLLSLFYRLAYRGADRLIAVSEAVKRDLAERRGARVPPGKITVIRHAPDDGLAVPAGEVERARQQLGLREDAVVLSAVAHLIPIKGHRYLVQAMAQVAPMLPRAVCVLIGDGPERGTLERMAHSLGLNGQVVFAGACDGALKRAVVQLSRAVVLPSLSEGLPVSLLEAMALGKPVIAADAGGMGELVADQVTGLLVPPADPAALAGAIRTLASDEALSGRMGQAGRRRIEEAFSSREMVQRVTALYEGLLG